MLTECAFCGTIPSTVFIVKQIIKFLYVFSIIAFAAVVMPKIVAAWETAQSAEAICSSEGIAKINVSFTNNEQSKSINVEAEDQQTGEKISLGSIEKGQTKTGEIDTKKESILNGIVIFSLTWTDGMSGSDKRSAKYKSISCLKPSPTPTLTPQPTPTVTVEPTPTPTETPIPTPTSTPIPTPTQTPNVGGPGDGLSDGKSDGRGGVSGISTGVLGLAATGNYQFIFGVILTGLSFLSTGLLFQFRRSK